MTDRDIEMSGIDEDGDNVGLSSGEKLKKHDSVLKNGWCSYFKVAVKEFFLGSWMNFLLIFTPLAFIGAGTCKEVEGGEEGARECKWPEGLIFTFALLSICPWAERLGFVTEDIAKYTNSTIGGLLNATFGNVTELVVAAFALKAGLLWVIQVSLLGSILSNSLLVLGCAFLVGGLRHPEQRFNRHMSSVNVSFLVMSTTTMLLPAILSASKQYHGGKDPKESEAELLVFSRITAVLTLASYGLFVWFQLKTHTHLFEDDEEDGDDDDDPPVLGFWGGIICLGIVTVFISFLSEFIVDTLKKTAKDSGVPALFIATILIPIVGNAAEHASAVIFAYKNKMAISMGIALGSSTQIAAFGVPFMVIVAWIVDKPLSMDFHLYQTATIFLSVMVVFSITRDGNSHWLAGWLLIMTYIIVGIGYWVHCDPDDPAGVGTCTFLKEHNATASD